MVILPPLRSHQDEACAFVDRLCGPQLYANIKSLVAMLGGWFPAVVAIVVTTGDDGKDAIALYSALAMKAERELAGLN
jgi:hypothetical protein